MEAEAAGIERRAAALSRNQEAVIAQQIAANLPEIVRAAASSFDHVGNFTVLNGAGGITEVLAEVEEREPRGEMVLVVEGASQQPSGDSRAAAREAVELVESGVRPRAAAADAARKHGVSANEVYRSLIERR